MRVALGSRLLTYATVLFLCFSVGCGSSGTSSDSGSTTGPTANDGLVNLQAMLKELAASNQPLPKSLAELARYDPVYPAAAIFLQNGSVTYYWGTPIDTSAPGASTLVIAHEAKAGTEGGWVLLQDGTIKQMKADEFKAAPKPQKKK